jgi:SAM-dependent methyltransferase
MPESRRNVPEFDAYARDYRQLIRDPIRDRFAPEGRFFAERKIKVLRDFYRTRGVDTRRVRWLDIGCGQGDLLSIGHSYFAAAAGCDPSAAMLAVCDGLDVRRQASESELPFDSASFDLITAVCVYHHVGVEERVSLTCEVLRVLRPGGIFAIIEHNPWNPATRLIVSRTPVDANAKLLSASAALKLMVGAGAKPVGTRFFLYFPERIYRYLAEVENALMWLPLGGQYSVFGTRD